MILFCTVSKSMTLVYLHNSIAHAFIIDFVSHLKNREKGMELIFAKSTADSQSIMKVLPVPSFFPFYNKEKRAVNKLCQSQQI